MGTLSEDMIDGILADSFPASDPPPWTLGRERQTDPMLAENSAKMANAQASVPERKALQTKARLAAPPPDLKFLKIKNGPPENFIEDTNRLSQMITARAYELYEKRGRQDGHALEDWIRAESEVLCIIPCGIRILESPKQLEVDVGLQGFCPDEIEIGVEPRRVFIGIKAKREDRKELEPAGRPRHFSICRVLDVPFEIVPEKAIATFKNGLLQLNLPKANQL